MAKRSGRAFVIEIVSDSKKAQKGFDSFSKSMKGALVGMGAAIGAREIMQFVGDSVMAAASLENLVGGASQVFGEYADAVVSASEAANSIGLSDAQYLTQANYFGNLATAIGYGEEAAFGLSDQFINLGSDFAAFFDAKPEQVIDSLASATRGEYDALQRYLPTISAARVEEEKLIVIRDSLVPITDEQAKLQAILNIAYDDGEAAIGAYAREADNLSTAVARFDTYKADAMVAFGAGIVEALEGEAGNLDAAGESMIRIAEVGGDIAGSGITAGLTGMGDAAGIFAENVSVADRAQYAWNTQLTTMGLAMPSLYGLLDKVKVSTVEAGTANQFLDETYRTSGATIGEWEAAYATTADSIVEHSEEIASSFDSTHVKIDEVYAATLDVYDLMGYMDSVRLNKLRAEWDSAEGRVRAYEQAVRDAKALTGILGGLASGQSGGGYTPGGALGPRAADGPVINFNGVVGDPVEVGREVRNVLTAYAGVRGL